MYMLKGQAGAPQARQSNNRSMERLQPYSAVKAKSVSNEVAMHQASPGGIRNSNASQKMRANLVAAERVFYEEEAEALKGI